MDHGVIPPDRERRREVVTDASANGDSGGPAEPPDIAPWGEVRQ